MSRQSQFQSTSSSDSTLQDQIVVAAQALTAIAAVNEVAKKQFKTDILASMTGNNAEHRNILDHVMAAAGIVSVIDLLELA